MTNGFGNAPGQPGYPGVTPEQAPSGPSAPGFAPPAGQPAGPSPLSAQGVENARQLAKWMKFFGIVQIVLGGMYCLSLAGAIVGWLPILLGWWKLKASGEVLQFAEAGDVSALEAGLNDLRLYYLTVGILTIIGLSMMVLVILAYVIMFFIFGVAIFGAAAGAGG